MRVACCLTKFTNCCWIRRLASIRKMAVDLGCGGEILVPQESFDLLQFESRLLAPGAHGVASSCLEHINQLRARGYPIVQPAIEGAVLRLRPIMMTMLVATFGLLPAATSHAIGSDSQRPFAIVIVGGG